MANLPAVRLSSYALQTTADNVERIRTAVRCQSPALTSACERAGVPASIAVICGGLLASVVDDLIAIGRLRRNDFERTKRKQRVLAVAGEPYASALRIAIAASPVNGRAAVEHWDIICEQHEIGKLAWLLGMPTETGFHYSERTKRKLKKGVDSL